MTPPPPRLEICTRERDGHPCLGRIHRSGVPEIAICLACGRREPGAIYILPDAPHGLALVPASPTRPATIEEARTLALFDARRLRAAAIPIDGLVGYRAADGEWLIWRYEDGAGEWFRERVRSLEAFWGMLTPGTE